MTDKKLLYIIQEQKADIERLNKEIQIGKDAYTMIQTKIAIIKSESIKEFAERLKEQAKNNEWNGTICGVDIDNLVKEMVGDE